MFPSFSSISAGRSPLLAAWLCGSVWVLLIGTAPSAAQETRPTAKKASASAADLAEKVYEEPSFFIERITVEGAQRVAPELILDESLLEGGRNYRESELGQALRRLNRLPFVLESSMALRRGSERGRYELVLRILETRSFFYSSDVMHTALASPLRLGDGEDDSTLQSNQLSGWRFFVGPHTMLFAALSNDQGVQIGVHRYNLFDRGLFLGFDVSRSSCCPVSFYSLGVDPGFGGWTSEDASHRATLTLGLPLSADQQIRFRAVAGESSRGERVDTLREGTPVQSFDDRMEWQLELSWTRDTTDDPLLPTRGRVLTVGLDYRALEVKLGSADQIDFLEQAQRSDLFRAVFGVTQHWPLNARQSLAGSVRAAFGRASVDGLRIDSQSLDGELDVLEGRLALQHSLAVWNAKMQRRFGDLRWENSASWSYDDASGSALPNAFEPLERWQFRSALVFRNAWGILRLGITYLDLGEPA